MTFFFVSLDCLVVVFVGYFVVVFWGFWGFFGFSPAILEFSICTVLTEMSGILQVKRSRGYL